MIDRKIDLPGYFKSPWPVECGGNRRQKSVNGSLKAKKILNQKFNQSRLIGGMSWLLEETRMNFT